jgi:hypothetical protein
LVTLRQQTIAIVSEGRPRLFATIVYVLWQLELRVQSPNVDNEAAVARNFTLLRSRSFET